MDHASRGRSAAGEKENGDESANGVFHGWVLACALSRWEMILELESILSSRMGKTLVRLLQFHWIFYPSIGLSLVWWIPDGQPELVQMG